MPVVKNSHSTSAETSGSPDRSPTAFSQSDDSQEWSTKDYERLLADYGGFGDLVEGELVKGRVLKITSSEVVVDVGYKSEGIIPVEEFLQADGGLAIGVGDEVEVLLEFAEDSEGHVVLSREKAEKFKAWDDIEKAYHEQVVFKGVVVSRVKGGLSVDIGVRAFLPGSQIDVKPIRNLDALIGQPIECRVIKINKRRNNIVVSRKVVVEERIARRRQEVLSQMEEGALIHGVVKNITDYGVFVDLGGIDGLLHITDISWGRTVHPSKIFAIGSEIQVKVLKFDKEKCRISLGRKQLSPDPWLTVPSKYPVGSRVQGKVMSLLEYGAFVELEEGVEGLIHVSEMSWNRRLKSAADLLTVGDRIEVVILEADSRERRLSLGLKQAEPDPWTSLAERYSIGQVISGKVRNLTEFGAFIEVEEGIDGLVHISDLSWTRKIKHPSEILKKGEQVSAVILSIHAENHRLSLGIRQLQADPWEIFFAQHPVGALVRGTVAKLTPDGAFVELGNGIEAHCHYPPIKGRVDQHADSFLEVGRDYDFEIVKLLREERKIGLAHKQSGIAQAKGDEVSFKARAGAQASSWSGEAARSGGLADDRGGPKRSQADS